jgi:hypothetical protein
VVEENWRIAALLALGVALGAVLFSTRFGFAGGYRRLLAVGDARGVGAQLLLIVLTSLALAPPLAFGQSVGAWFPLGWTVPIGAFLFGVGMMLGGGCGSGTLYALGGGAARLAITLAFFCFGAFASSLHLPWWRDALGGGQPQVLGDMIGWAPAIGLQTAVALALGLTLHRALGDARPWRDQAIGAALLALLGGAVALVAGQPWSVTWAFGLWAAKGAVAVGWDPETSAFWREPAPAAALDAPFWSDPVGLLDLGVLAGSFLAAVVSRRFRLDLDFGWRQALAAVVGGLLMGYGARLSGGCNIGALVAGIASTSLHGWAWLFAVLPGCWVGMRARPWFRLDG